jgi:serine/threonine-protein kinase RsbT
MQKIEITDQESLLNVRQIVHSLAREIGFGLVDQTRITTVASELTRNILLYAKKGRVEIYNINGSRIGIKMIFIDEGPGIDNIELAMKDGYTTSGGMGKGLPGSKRLMDEFYIESAPGKGAKVTAIKWLKG